MDISDQLVRFYAWWHGRLHLRGAGKLMRMATLFCPRLKSYEIDIPGWGSSLLDFSDYAGYAWYNKFVLQEQDQEGGMVAYLLARMTPDTVLWDIGANCGLLAACILREVKVARYIAFEPNPGLCELINNNFSRHPEFELLSLGLSDHCESVQFHIPKGDSSCAAITPNINHTRNCNNVLTIACETADNICLTRNIPPPSIVKIDVEGHEAQVIKGMGRTIAQTRPIIVFENIFFDGDTVENLLPSGYQLYTIFDEDGSAVEGFHPEAGHNCVFEPTIFMQRWHN